MSSARTTVKALDARPATLPSSPKTGETTDSSTHLHMWTPISSRTQALMLAEVERLRSEFTHFSAAEELKFARQRRTGTAGPRRL